VDAFDDKWFYMTQTFTSPSTNGKPEIIYAQATVRALICKFNGTKISPETIFSQLGIDSATLGKIKRPEDVPACKSLLDWDDAVDKDMKSFNDV